LYKDQVYLEGAVFLLRNRYLIDFKGLMCGKLSIDEARRPMIERRLKKESILEPPFMQDYQKYLKALDIIAKTNFIDKLSPNLPKIEE